MACRCQTKTETETATDNQQPASQAPLTVTGNIRQLTSTSTGTAHNRATSQPAPKRSGRSGSTGKGGQTEVTDTVHETSAFSPMYAPMPNSSSFIPMPTFVPETNPPNLSFFGANGQPCYEIPVPQTPSTSHQSIPTDPLSAFDPWQRPPPQVTPFRRVQPVPSGSRGNVHFAESESVSPWVTWNHTHASVPMTPTFSADELGTGQFGNPNLHSETNPSSYEQPWTTPQRQQWRPDFQESFPSARPHLLPESNTDDRQTMLFHELQHAAFTQSMQSEGMRSAVSTRNFMPTMNQDWSQRQEVVTTTQPASFQFSAYPYSELTGQGAAQMPFYSPGMLSSNAHEFHPDGTANTFASPAYAYSSPAIPTPSPLSTAMPGHLLGPLLPGFVNSTQHQSQFAANLGKASAVQYDEFNNVALGTVPGSVPASMGRAAHTLQQFVPPQHDGFEMQGSGILPGIPDSQTQSENPFSQTFHSLRACPKPFEAAPCFQQQSFGPISGGKVGGWGANMDDEFNAESFRPPAQETTRVPFTRQLGMQTAMFGSAPPPPPPSTPGGYDGQNPHRHFPSQTPHRILSDNYGMAHGPPQPPRPPFPPQGPPGPMGPQFPGGGGGGGFGGGFGGGGGGFGGGGAGNNPNNRQKRWLPPPSWSPGAQNQPTYRGWLWQLAGWSRLTGMPWEDRGTAVALSLGGRAGRIAQGLPHDWLGRRDGLFLLLQKIEQELGSELQDRVRNAGRQFLKFRRPRNMQAAEYISEYERLYTEGVQHGLYFNPTMLSMMLVEHANLSTTQEDWILQTVAADWTKYAEIRTAFRRLPSLDTRHSSETQNWPVNAHDSSSWQQPASSSWQQPASSSWQQPASAQPSVPHPFQDQHLNLPIQEYGASETQNNDWDFTGFGDEDDSDSDDDFCSSCPSHLDMQEFEQTQQAWAMNRARRFGKGKKGKRRGYRTGGRRPANVWAVDNKRNLSQEVPAGWDSAKWLARVPCAGCGSRWHRQCEGKGKVFAIKGRKKGGHKGKGKGKAPQFGKGQSAFGTFVVLAASMMQGASSVFQCSLNYTNATLANCYDQSKPFWSEPELAFEDQPFVLHQPFILPNISEPFICQPCKHDLPQFSLEEIMPQLYTDNALPMHRPIALACEGSPLSPLNHLKDVSVVSTSAVHNPDKNEHQLSAKIALNPDPRELPPGIQEVSVQSSQHAFQSVPTLLNDHDSKHVFKADQISPWLTSRQHVFTLSTDWGNWAEDNENTFVGFEPHDTNMREKRWAAFKSAKQRFGLLIDTGAPDSCCGQAWLLRFIEAFNISGQVIWSEHKASLSGIGEGSAKCNWLVDCPIGIESGPAAWRTQMLEGIGEKVPPLFGLTPMTNRQGVIDLRDPHYTGRYKLHMDSDTDRKSLTIFYVNGHLILPVDWGGLDLPDKTNFISDPLGLSVYVTTNTSVSTNGAGVKAAENFDISSQFEPLQPVLFDEPSVEITVKPSTPPSAPPGLTMPQWNHQSTVGGQEKCIPLPGPCRSSDINLQRSQTLNDTRSLPAVHYGITKHLRQSAKQIQQLLRNHKTYKNKYVGLPIGTPIPLIDIKYTRHKTWDIWEWWAGEGILSRTCTEEGFIVGPPITWDTGWCLKLESHRDALKHLMSVYRPSVLFGAPTCAPWSSACTTLDPLVKAIVRREETTVFSFFCDMCFIQDRQGRFYLYEQPKSSELLRTDLACNLQEKTNSTDNTTCMCMHGLKDPFNGKANMKMTVLRGTVILTNKTNRWCDNLHEHQQLKGTHPNGKLRTAVAQTYTKSFCKRLARDIKNFLFDQEKNFPVFQDGYELDADEVPNPEYEVDEPAPPMETGTRDEQRNQLEESIRRQRETAMPAPPSPPVPVKPRLLPTAKRATKSNPFRETMDLWDEEERNQSQDKSRITPPASPGASGSKDPVVSIPEVTSKSKSKQSKGNQHEIPDAVLDLAVPPPLEIKTTRPATQEQSTIITEMRDAIAFRVPVKGTATIQTGTKLKVLQELFGTPHGKVVLGATLSKKPTSSISPEPLISREVAPLKLELTIESDKQLIWTIHPWEKYKTTLYSKRPAWLLMIYGREESEGELAGHLRSSPWDTAAQERKDAEQPLNSLPQFMNVLRNGTEEEKIAIVLALHRRLYHKPPADLRKILQKSGASLHSLSLVDKACAQCEICLMWAKSHAKPAVKSMHATRFNAIVYGDLVFFDSFICMVLVDEAIRFTIITVIEYKDAHSLMHAFRRFWIALFGPPKIFRSDKEGAFASEEFSVGLERMGTQRELIVAEQQHSYLGILDRRIQIVRFMMPKIMSELSAELVVCDAEDAAAECQYAVNSLMQYRGSSPYSCLFGQEPSPIFEEASDFLSSNVDDCLGFYEHHQVRAKAVQVFHEALLQQRLERALDARARTDYQGSYRIGQWVDIYRKPKQKSLTGWRGPAVVLAHLSEGFLTVRWQSMCLDVPVNHIRPHMVFSPHASLANSGPAPQSTEQAKDISAATVEDQKSEEAAAHYIHDMCEWESYYQIEASDNSSDLHPSAQTLVSVAASMPVGTQLLHALEYRQGHVVSSEHARRDGHQIFDLGRHWASDRQIPNYVGVILSAGKRYTTQQKNVSAFHAMWWFDDVKKAAMQHSVFEGDQSIDWIQEGIEHSQLCHLRVIVLLEGSAVSGPPLLQLLNASSPLEPAIPFEQVATGRVRDHPIELPIVSQAHSAATTRVASVDGEPWNRATQFDSEGFDINLPENQHSEMFVALIRGRRLTSPEPALWDKRMKMQDHMSTASCSSYAMSSSHDNTNSVHSKEIWFIEDFGFVCGQAFPLARDSGELKSSDYIEYKKECHDAAIKELTAWIKQKAGRAMKLADYVKKTGLKPLPSRWVDIFKRKSGVKIIKRRLVLKGFAERNQESMETASPTATRIGHRWVMMKSAEWGTPIVSYDVSTAFLQGDSFENLNASGHSRQACAFIPPPGVFETLHEVDPLGGWGEAAKRPSEWVFELDKGAYGLKDAPLLWFMRINRFLIANSFTPMKHDACVYYHLNPADQIDTIISLHVDDTLGTGDQTVLKHLHQVLESQFGSISAETDNFKHFGVNVSRCLKEKHVFACQKEYVADLVPIELPSGKASTIANTLQVTAFRSLVSGVAWVGVTHAGAAAGASLYQGCLPNPTYEDIRHLNVFLKQLKDTYKPLVFRHGLQPTRILTIADSSLGNMSKYSQGGYFVLICVGDNALVLCGHCNVLSFRSAKSKRVASSTLHAECLSLVAGAEEASHLQTWFYEFANPRVPSFDILNVDPSKMIPIVAVTDCKDLLDVLTKTAVTAVTNRAMTLYVAALRELKETKRVEQWCWCDTRDNVANALTKLETDGCLPMEPLNHMLAHGAWEPVQPYRWGQTLCDPSTFSYVPFTQPIPQQNATPV